MTGSDHEELNGQLGAYVIGALEPAEQTAIEAHLASCAECAAEVRALQGAADALAWSVTPLDPPPAVRRRVMSAIARPVPTANRRGFPAPQPRVAWLAAAASFALAVGLGAYAAELRGRVRSLEGQLQSAVLQARTGEQQAAQARLVAAGAERELSILAAPDVAHVDLKGQAVAPEASARALWSRSRGLLFAASSLPAPPEGRTYQLWILSGAAAPLSDGWLFKTDADGSVTTMFRTPIGLPAPTAMAVTLEPDGGTSAPTGAMYLVGSLN